MAEFIIELYSEEIPAGMQARAADNLARLVTALLAKANLHPTQSQTYVAPQRLALLLDGLDKEIPAQRIEKKGPRVNAPTKTIEGFLKAQGLTDTKQLQIKTHPKGDFYLSVQHKPARATREFLQEALPQLISTFPWPKSMCWGAGRLRWVRPLRSILCLFDGQPVPFVMDGLASDLIAGDVTYGHRFLAPAPITIKRNKDYLPQLEKAKVLADPQARMERIRTQATKLAKAKGLELMANEKLLTEIAGLIEWPVCLMGEIDKNFLTLPPEVLTAVMHTHQKYLTLKDPKSGQLAPYFIIISNMETKDKGATIIAGNERVLRARLADAEFFWTQDKKTALRDRLPHLENIIFHAQLGTVADKAERLQKLAPQ
ncbi:MAG: glycine--tRNA ligase subunit beta, partial [Alphaproteobacteria bacterium]|nr:glycine--tRNA ligase subunit beta [Alphaproteobacteria bacterium]